MTRITVVFAAGLALAAFLPTLPAQAQNTRSFVSGLGSDSNSCTLAAPCRSFQHAHDQTNAGGEIAVLDTAGYGTLTITKSISIVNPGGVEAGILVPSGGTGITINASGAIVALRGLTLEGAATGQNGIQFNTGASLNVRDSVIRNFTSDGIIFEPDASSQILVSNTLASNNGSVGIEIVANGSGTTIGVLDHVTMENNLNDGLLVLTAAQTVNMTISDSVSANNGSSGIVSNSSSSGVLSAMVRNSTIANNGADGLQANGTGALIRVTRSTITGNFAGWADVSSGVVLSYADNNIDGNGGANTTPPGPLSYH